MNGIFQNMFKFILEGLDDCVEVWRCKEAQFSTWESSPGTGNKASPWREGCPRVGTPQAALKLVNAHLARAALLLIFLRSPASPCQSAPALPFPGSLRGEAVAAGKRTGYFL